jgi:hypothetical protein
MALTTKHRLMCHLLPLCRVRPPLGVLDCCLVHRPTCPMHYRITRQPLAQVVRGLGLLVLHHHTPLLARQPVPFQLHAPIIHGM